MPSFPLRSWGRVFCTLTLHSVIFFSDAERAAFNTHRLCPVRFSCHSSAVLSPMRLPSHLFLFFSLQLCRLHQPVVKCVKFSLGINFSYNKGQILAQQTFQLSYQLLVFALT